MSVYTPVIFAPHDSRDRPGSIALLRYLLEGEVYGWVDESGETRFSAVPPDSNAVRLAESLLELVDNEFVVWAHTQVVAPPQTFRYLRLGPPELARSGELRLSLGGPRTRFQTRIAICERPSLMPAVVAAPRVVDEDGAPVHIYALTVPALAMTLVEARHFLTFLVHAAACGDFDLRTFTTKFDREST